MELFIPGSKKEKEKLEYELVIIGAGPAGLSAGIYATRSGLKGIVVEKNVVGGLAAEAPFIENYPGIKGIKGEELAKMMKEHAQEYLPVEEMNPVHEITKENDKFIIKTEKAEYVSDAIIFATGTTHKHLGVPGEKEFYGRGLSYCVTCDGYFFKDQDVIIIGGGNSGAIAGIFMKNIDRNVTIIEFMPRYMCENAYVKKINELGINYIMNAQVTEIFGDEKVKGIRYKDRVTGEAKELLANGVFIYVGLKPQSELAKSLGVDLNERGYIKVDNTMRTNIPRLYAAGDVTGGIAQVVVAASQGVIAALSAYEDLKLKG